MSVEFFFLISLLLGFGTRYAVEHFTQRRRHAALIARRVIINLKSGQAIDGVLTKTQGEYYFITTAQLLEEGLQPAGIDGEVLVHRSEVDFIQYP